MNIPYTRFAAVGALFLTLSAETPASSVFVILPGVVQTAGTGALISMAAAGLVGKVRAPAADGEPYVKQ